MLVAAIPARWGAGGSRDSASLLLCDLPGPQVLTDPPGKVCRGLSDIVERAEDGAWDRLSLMDVKVTFTTRNRKDA